MHLLRAKLSFLGANRFDPKGDLWVRVTFFQGSPLIEDLRQDMAQDPSQVHLSVQLRTMMQAGLMTGASRSLRSKRLVKVSANELQAQLNKAFLGLGLSTAAAQIPVT